MSNISKKKSTIVKRSHNVKFSMPIQEARIDMENIDKLEGSLNIFKRDFDLSQKLYIDKMKRVTDDQLDSIMIYYTKVHPDLLLIKVDVDELPKEAKIGLLAVKRGHARATAISD